ncbi:hypothetical protein ACTOXX_34270 [Streptomyces rubiginosohelvolus]|uniref:hypothetical protein n=1 Tax=Streptomyces rubiginosohelvolus TaxID=67362 RepID=UPI003F91B4C4
MTAQPRPLPTDVVEARLNHLIDRARRNRLLHEEADRFTTELRDLVRRMEDTEDERDRLATEAKILRARVNDQNAAADVAVSAVRLMNEAGAQRDRAEARVRELEAENARYEATLARVRQAVDAGPVGSCCAHLIRAALNPPAAPGHSEGAAGT